MFICCDYPCSDDCERVLAYESRPINDSIYSPTGPQPAPSFPKSSSECE